MPLGEGPITSYFDKKRKRNEAESESGGASSSKKPKKGRGRGQGKDVTATNASASGSGSALIDTKKQKKGVDTAHTDARTPLSKPVAAGLVYPTPTSTSKPLLPHPSNKQKQVEIPPIIDLTISEDEKVPKTPVRKNRRWKTPVDIVPETPECDRVGILRRESQSQRRSGVLGQEGTQMEMETQIVPSSQSQEVSLTPRGMKKLGERRMALMSLGKDERKQEEVEKVLPSDTDDDEVEFVPSSQSQMENEVTFDEVIRQRNKQGLRSQNRDLDRKDSMVAPISDIDISSLFEGVDHDEVHDEDTHKSDDAKPNEEAGSATESEAEDEDWWRKVPPRAPIGFMSPSQRTREKEEEEKENDEPETSDSHQQRQPQKDLSRVELVLQDWPSQLTLSVSEADDSQYSYPPDAKEFLDMCDFGSPSRRK
ncbi:hypothetical protein VNI00_001049 [Paramarasmius palmivorus]|uniref:Uncharacterized protein n=1 Tax=Paramarasmius palmivorus TaxID=297713 RepID=A0AAW0E8V5_9AGAR